MKQFRRVVKRALQGRFLPGLCLISLLWATWGEALHAGPLADKARVFDRRIQLSNCPEGMVFDARIDTDGKFVEARSGGDSTIWTGAYVAAQAFRYLTASEPEALANVERSLRAFHKLHLISGGKGFLGRCFGRPEWFGRNPRFLPGTGEWNEYVYLPDTSRDQYTGLFMAYAVSQALPLSSETRRLVREDARAIGRNLVANNLALRAEIGSVTRFPFKVDPTYCYQDRINPHEWKVVDDFPANVFTALIPFDERLARILSTFQPPPIRGGEALRALLMLQTAAALSGDAEIAKFFHEEICGRRKFPRIASETSQLLGDLYLGASRETLIRICGGLATALAHLNGEAMIHAEWLPRGVVEFMQTGTDPVVDSGGRWVGRMLIGLFDHLRRPGAFLPLAELADGLARWHDGLKMFGPATTRLADRIKGTIAWLREAAGSNLDELADAQRSYVGTNLTFFALLGLLESPSGTETDAAARDILERAFRPIADERKTLYTYIRAAHGASPLPPQRLDEAKAALLEYPLDQRIRRIDHSQDSGLRYLPWPDRFGHFRNQADQIFPLDQMAPYIFIWQESPRRVVSGRHGDAVVAPVGYLLAYWYGRYRGFLTAED